MRCLLLEYNAVYSTVSIELSFNRAGVGAFSELYLLFDVLEAEIFY